MTELTKLYPMVQIKKNTWEIDEFDCASIFLLIGTEKAMVIDCGMGIGDLRGAIEMITDKPLICVISHGHIDHTANARQFGEIWLNPKDQGIEIPTGIMSLAITDDFFFILSYPPLKLSIAPFYHDMRTYSIHFFNEIYTF